MTMPTGRRERNKEEKRERIIAAASDLFAHQSVDDVTTQQIADAADIGAGTLFLYAKNKGELLLMVQNAHYADALAEGIENASHQENPVEAVMSLIAPIVACNRAHVGNGRTYLREMAFGDPAEPHHARALAIVEDTESQLTRIFLRTTRCDGSAAGSLARTVSALLLRNMAPPAELSGDSAEILLRIRRDLLPLLTVLA